MTMLHIAGGVILGVVGVLALAWLVEEEHYAIAGFLLFMLATLAFT